MSLKSWLTSGYRKQQNYGPGSQKVDKSGQDSNGGRLEDTSSISFEDIVSHFDEANQKVARLQKENTDQQSKLKDYLKQLQEMRNEKEQKSKSTESQIQRLTNDLKKERKIIKTLQDAIGGQHRAQESRQKGPTEPFVNILQKERAERKKEITDLQQRIEQLKHEKERLQKQLGELTLEHEEKKLDIEYLKCTARVSPNQKHTVPEGLQDSSLLEVPFVLVLVDGDAYQFAEFLPNQYSDPSVHPAVRMAQNIKINLQTYITTNGLAPHCRLIVRVLANGHGIKGRRGPGIRKGSESFSDVAEEFMTRFTEFSPSFEFFDAGRGKERVDSKIHELYHTFLPNPSCKKIFLATARDNGFARMLEQHIHNPTARAKTCLISAGEIAAEIERLNLETIEWPTVFARQFRPKAMALKDARNEAQRTRKENMARDKEAKLRKDLGREGYEDLLKRQAFQHLTRQLVRVKSVETLFRELARKDARRIGVRTEIIQPVLAEGTQVWRPHDDNGHEGFCVDVGVD